MTRGDLTLLDVLPDLAEVVDPAAEHVLRRAFARRTTTLGPGPWDPGPLAGREDVFGLVVLDGLLIRATALSGRVHTELYGPGDVTTPWVHAVGLLPVEISWQAVGRTTIALLDHVVLAAAGRWPAIAAVLVERHGETCARLATHKAICQLPRVEERITYMLWHAAERLGRIGTGTVTVPLPLTHEELGHLVGARRSTVTLALGELEQAGVVERRADGAFVLFGTAPPFEPVRRPPARRTWRAARPTADMDGLRDRLDRLGVKHREATARTAGELARARLVRERSAALRDELRHERAPHPSAPA